MLCLKNICVLSYFVKHSYPLCPTFCKIQSLKDGPDIYSGVHPKANIGFIKSNLCSPHLIEHSKHLSGVPSQL